MVMLQQFWTPLMSLPKLEALELRCGGGGLVRVGVRVVGLPLLAAPLCPLLPGHRWERSKWRCACRGSHTAVLPPLRLSTLLDGVGGQSPAASHPLPAPTASYPTTCVPSLSMSPLRDTKARSLPNRLTGLLQLTSLDLSENIFEHSQPLECLGCLQQMPRLQVGWVGGWVGGLAGGCLPRWVGKRAEAVPRGHAVFLADHSEHSVVSEGT